LLDSGAALFMSGQFYYRQLDDLAISICGAHELTDEYWREFHEGSHALTKKLAHSPKVSAITFALVQPNAAQRRWSAEFLVKNDVQRIPRIAVFTDSMVLRGAMTAYSWFVRDSTLRPFECDDVRAGFAWLQEIGRFDATQAMNVWREGHVKVGLARPSLRP
jgi:hypothetical protein